MLISKLNKAKASSLALKTSGASWLVITVFSFTAKWDSFFHISYR